MFVPAISKCLNVMKLPKFVDHVINHLAGDNECDYSHDAKFKIQH